MLDITFLMHFNTLQKSVHYMFCTKQFSPIYIIVLEIIVSKKSRGIMLQILIASANLCYFTRSFKK